MNDQESKPFAAAVYKEGDECPHHEKCAGYFCLAEGSYIDIVHMSVNWGFWLECSDCEYSFFGEELAE